MDRRQFLANLMAALPAGVDQLEASEFIDYYDEVIRDFIADGYTEAEAVAMVGDPAEIVAQSEFFKGDFLRNTPQTAVKKVAPWVIILLILGFPLWGSLALAAFCLFISAYIILWVPLIITGSFTLAGVIGGPFAMLTSFFAFGDGLGIGLLQFGSGALLLGLGLICGVITWKIGGSLLKITFNLTKFIIGKMKGQVTAYGF
ncbi:DUF1700 domain-containing protein [Enterococcus sp. S86.2]|uniref:DUF1700 domain-containing protein n=1 Tax=Enterococcus sp. S86.2 TaxID=3031299 RepID=UPI0026EFC887|nr:DUF1700 domain-containing protein [Enterococcus sp. S86.2]